MSWNYSGDPSQSNKDAVRFYAGLTDTNEQFITDEEIKFLLNEEGTVVGAAASACESVAGFLSREADTEAGDASVELSQRADNFRTQAKKLRKRVAIGQAKPIAPAISKDDKETQEDDSDRVSPFFQRSMHDNTRAGDQEGT